MLGFIVLATALNMQTVPATEPGVRLCTQITDVSGQYYTRATATDSEGNESALSNQRIKTYPGEVCVTTPTQNVDGTGLTDLSSITFYYSPNPIVPTGDGVSPDAPSIPFTITCDTCEEFTGTLYHLVTGESVNIALDSPGEVEIHVWPPVANSVPVVRANVQQSFDWTPTRAGMYFHRTRADPGQEWENSHNYGTLYSVRLAPPTPGGID